MSRNPTQRIADALEAIERCLRYVAALDRDADIVEMAEDAIERNLQIVGEAVQHLPEEITGAHPEIPWPQIRGFRNILVHQYFGVDVDIVRDVVETHLPPLAEALRSSNSRGDLRN
ncbi:MAG: HepT-like ribonuclease domain-containing protein [Gordonia sp. (in: high G+C Gram-positive bacteria)]|uniref:HepT-like ribonuclease domain-containing protein n=1 Tax=Gordonia sp. (in: high G+C Gram-positive bacteria) TaxID=84139 RepID=UPI003C764BF1